MSKATIKAAQWNKEMKGNVEAVLLDRLRFHNALHLDTLRECTGMSEPTIRKHMGRLVAKGLAVYDHKGVWIQKIK